MTFCTFALFQRLGNEIQVTRIGCSFYNFGRQGCPEFGQAAVPKSWASPAPKSWERPCAQNLGAPCSQNLGRRPESSFQRFGNACSTFGRSRAFAIGVAFSLISRLAQILETLFPEFGHASPNFWAPRLPKCWGTVAPQILETQRSQLLGTTPAQNLGKQPP